MADFPDASFFFPNFNDGISMGNKLPYRLFQGSSIRRAFNNFRSFYFLIVIK